MTIMTRFVRLFKADIHGVMDQLEDKGLLLRQYVREMQATLNRKERQLGALSERMDRLSAHVERHTEEMRKLDQDINLAIAKEKEDIARKLIRRHHDLEIAVGHLKEQAETTAMEQTHLAATIREQKLQYETLQARAETWHRRPADDPFACSPLSFANHENQSNTCDEEIELELIRRREALRAKGGTA